MFKKLKINILFAENAFAFKGIKYLHQVTKRNESRILKLTKGHQNKTAISKGENNCAFFSSKDSLVAVVHSDASNTKTLRSQEEHKTAKEKELITTKERELNEKELKTAKEKELKTAKEKELKTAKEKELTTAKEKERDEKSWAANIDDQTLGASKDEVLSDSILQNISLTKEARHDAPSKTKIEKQNEQKGIDLSSPEKENGTRQTAVDREEPAEIKSLCKNDVDQSQRHAASNRVSAHLLSTNVVSETNSFVNESVNSNMNDEKTEDSVLQTIDNHESQLHDEVGSTTKNNGNQSTKDPRHGASSKTKTETQNKQKGFDLSSTEMYSSNNNEKTEHNVLQTLDNRESHLHDEVENIVTICSQELKNLDEEARHDASLKTGIAMSNEQAMFLPPFKEQQNSSRQAGIEMVSNTMARSLETNLDQNDKWHAWSCQDSPIFLPTVSVSQKEFFGISGNGNRNDNKTEDSDFETQYFQKSQSQKTNNEYFGIYLNKKKDKSCKDDILVSMQIIMNYKDSNRESNKYCRETIRSFKEWTKFLLHRHGDFNDICNTLRASIPTLIQSKRDRASKKAKLSFIRLQKTVYAYLQTDETGLNLFEFKIKDKQSFTRLQKVLHECAYLQTDKTGVNLFETKIDMFADTSLADLENDLLLYGSDSGDNLTPHLEELKNARKQNDFRNEVPGRKATIYSNLPKSIFVDSDNIKYMMKYLKGISINHLSLFEMHTHIFNNSMSDKDMPDVKDAELFKDLVTFLFDPSEFHHLSHNSYENTEEMLDLKKGCLLGFQVLINEKPYDLLFQSYLAMIDGVLRPKYRLIVVTAEVFEDAMRQFQIEQYEVTYTNYFPRNCRMFVHIPVYKGGFINRRDNKDRGITQ